MLLLAGAGKIQAQAPGRALMDALRSQTATPGGCRESPDTATVAISFYPGVRFTRGTCTLEHGDPTSAIVGVDGDSVLYLLGSLSSLRFLERRHPPVGGDSALVRYAMTALELTGNIPVQGARIVRRSDVVPAVRLLLPPDGRLLAIFHRGRDRRLTTVVVHTLTPGFDGPSVDRFEVDIMDGRVIFVTRTPLSSRVAKG